MHPDNPLRIAIKYLTFITPPVILMIVGFVLFHSLMLAVTFTLIVGTIGLIGLAYWVSSRGEYTEEINRKQKRAQRKVFDMTISANEKVNRLEKFWLSLKKRLRT